MPQYRLHPKRHCQAKMGLQPCKPSNRDQETFFCDCFVFVLQGCNSISARQSHHCRAEMGLQSGKPSARDCKTLFRDCYHKHLCWTGRYITMTIKHSFQCIKILPSPCAIMCCSPHNFSDRAATRYHTQA